MSRALLAPAAHATHAALGGVAAAAEAHVATLRVHPLAVFAARYLAVLTYLSCGVSLFLIPHCLAKFWADLRDDPVKLLLIWLYATLAQLCLAAAAAPGEAGSALAAFRGADAAAAATAAALAAASGVTCLAQALLAPPAAFPAFPAAHIVVALLLRLAACAAAHAPLPPTRQLAAACAACVAAVLSALGARGGGALAFAGAASAASASLSSRLSRAHGPRATALATLACNATFTVAALLGAFFFKGTHWHWVAERRRYIAWSTSCLVFTLLTACQGAAATAVLHAFGPLSKALLSGIAAFLFAIGVGIVTAQPLPPLAGLCGVAACASYGVFEAHRRDAAGLGAAGGDASEAQTGLPRVKSHAHAQGDDTNAAGGPAWMRLRACAAIAVVSIALPCALRHHLHAIPVPLRLSTWIRPGDAARPHLECGMPPALNAMAPRFASCPVNPPFFDISEGAASEGGGAVLTSNCSSAFGGIGTYMLSPVIADSVDQRVWPRRPRNAKRVPLPASGRVVLPRGVLTLRVTCRLRRGHGPIMDEIVLVPPNLWADANDRWLANGKHAPPAPVPDARPSALVILMDALSRSLANAALVDLTRLFREQRLRSVTAFEFDAFSVIGVRSNDNWPAMFCNGRSCDEVETNLFDFAGRSRMATARLNNFCQQRPEVHSPRSNFSMEATISEGFVCVRGTGMTESCAHGQSVSRSFIETAGYLIRRAHGAGRRFMTLVAPHEAHMTPHGKLMAVQPRIIKMLQDLDASGALENAVVLFLADHGLHYDNQMDTYAPAAAAHRNPVLFVLVGNALMATLPPDATRTMLRNRGRLVGMLDIWATLAAVVGAPAALRKSGAVDLLRDEIPEARSCDDAHVRDYCNCFGPTQHRFDEHVAN
jgi:hypothetical protein